MKLRIFSFIRTATFLLIGIAFLYCPEVKSQERSEIENKDRAYIVVLGTVQDAGSPHAACQKACCKDLFDKPDPSRKVVSLGLIDFTMNDGYSNVCFLESIRIQ